MSKIHGTGEKEKEKRSWWSNAISANQEIKYSIYEINLSEPRNKVNLEYNILGHIVQ